MGIEYSENPQTIGGEILNSRLGPGRLQRDVAKELSMTRETMTNWGNNYIMRKCIITLSRTFTLFLDKLNGTGICMAYLKLKWGKKLE